MNSSEISFRDSKSSNKDRTGLKANKQPQVLELSDMSQKLNLNDGSFKNEAQQPLFDNDDAKIESKSDTRSQTDLTCGAKIKRWLLSPEHNATFKCICFFIYFITIFILLAFFMLLYFLDYGQTLSTFGGSLDYLSQNLIAVPIQEIAVLPVGSECPLDYNAVTLGEFAGTTNGCYCPNDNVLMQGSCSRKSNCTYYDGIEPQQINNWKQHIFCIKTAENLVVSESCDLDYTECYPGGCIPSNETCPITQSTLTSALNSSSLADSALEIQIIQDTPSTNLEDMPIVFLQTSLIGLPCFDSNALQEDENNYPLSQSDPEGCGTYGEDTTAFEIDSQNDLDLYSQNGFSSLISKLPLYETYFQQEQILLIGREKIQVNNISACLNIDTTLISDFANTLNLLDTRTSITLTYAAYLHIIVFVSCLAVYYFMKSGLAFRKQIFQDDKFQFLYLLLVLLELILYFQLFIYITGVTISSTSQVDRINTYTILQCFLNTQTSTMLQDFRDSIEGTVNAVYGISALLFFAQAGSLTLLSIGFIGGKINDAAKKRKVSD